MPPAAAPTAPTPAAAPPPAAPTNPLFGVAYSTNVFRLDQKTLHGAAISKGSTIYVFATSWSLDDVGYWYPSGSNAAENPPFDMAGTTHGGLLPKGWKVPSQTGTYTITATATKQSQVATITVTFHVV